MGILLVILVAKDREIDVVHIEVSKITMIIEVRLQGGNEQIELGASMSGGATRNSSEDALS